MTWIYGGYSTQEKMHRYLSRVEPGLERFLVSTWNAEQSAIKFDEIRDAVMAGGFDSARFEEWREGYVRFVNESLEPAWLAAFKKAGTPLAEAIADKSYSTFKFNPAWKWIDAWTKSNGSQLVTRLSDEQRAAMQALIRHFTVDEPINPIEAARYIRPAIGLTEQQTVWLTNYRPGLMSEGITGHRLEQLVAKKAESYLRSRAKIIARTEMARGWGHGQQNTMREALNEGKFPGRQCYKTWFTAQDERVCQICGPLDSEKVPIDDDYSIGVSVPSDSHVSCRCDEGYSVE